MEWNISRFHKRTNWLPSKPISKVHTITFGAFKDLKGRIPAIYIGISHFCSGSLSLSKGATSGLRRRCMYTFSGARVSPFLNIMTKEMENSNKMYLLLGRELQLHTFAYNLRKLYIIVSNLPIGIPTREIQLLQVEIM